MQNQEKAIYQCLCFNCYNCSVQDRFSDFSDDNEISASGKNTKAPLGVEVLYGTFQKWGYQTLFQEDLCWYDMWGSALTDIEKRDMPSGDSEFKSR